jgi:hypothetical protein
VRARFPGQAIQRGTVSAGHLSCEAGWRGHKPIVALVSRLEFVFLRFSLAIGFFRRAEGGRYNGNLFARSREEFG